MLDFDLRSPLTRAIEIWKTGRNISMTLAVKLMQEGFDVPSLERAYKQ
jgi:hypothetical protein